MRPALAGVMAFAGGLMIAGLGVLESSPMGLVIGAFFALGGAVVALVPAPGVEP